MSKLYVTMISGYVTVMAIYALLNPGTGNGQCYCSSVQQFRAHIPLYNDPIRAKIRAKIWYPKLVRSSLSDFYSNPNRSSK